MATNKAWLDKAVEEVIDPDIAIVDCHHHFYQHWGEYFPYQPEYIAENIAEDLNDGHNIAATVCVEVGYGYYRGGPEVLRPVGETEFMLSCASSYRKEKLGPTELCKGIIAHADLRLGSQVEEVFLAHREVAGERLKGIRQLAAAKLSDTGLDKTERLLPNREFRQGFSVLQQHNLTFDAWILHPQLTEVFELGKQFPDTTIILNHLGAPVGIGPYANRRSEVMKAWQKEMQRLCELHNVVVKLGGINMTLNGFDWDKRPAPPDSDELLAETRDYYLRAIDYFTPDRCMFESNFPVDKISVSYRTLWNAFKKIAREFNHQEATAMLAGNAERIYRLQDTSDLRPPTA